MDPIASILRNSALLMGAKVVSAGMGLTLVVILPRMLGDAGYGQLYLTISLVALFGTVVDFGLTPVMARAVAHDHGLTRVYLGHVVRITVVMSVLAYAALLALAAAPNYPAGTEVVVAVLGVSILFEGLVQILTGLFQAHERMLVPALARVAGTGLTLALLLPRLWTDTPTSPVTVAGCLAAGSLLRLLIAAAGTRGLEGLRRASTVRRPWRGLLAAGLPFLLWQALGLLYFRIDVMMLGHMTPAATIGWYGAAARLVDGLTFIADVIALTSYPVMARLWLSDSAEFRRTIERTLELLLVVTVPLVVALFMLAGPIVETLFTAEFVNTVPILRVHAFTLGFLFLDYFLATILMAIGRERAWLGIAVMACVLNPSLNWVAIRHTQDLYGNGGIGAALATLATEICVASCALSLVPRGAIRGALVRIAPPLALAAAVTAGVIAAGLAAEAPWLLAGGAGALAYLGLVLGLGVVPPDMLRRVRAAVAWRPSREVLS
jgi:O-antigen/teichoic acid export membrane protein